MSEQREGGNPGKPSAGSFTIRAILDKMPDEPRQPKQVIKETSEQKRVRELAERRLAIGALERSLAGRLVEDTRESSQQKNESVPVTVIEKPVAPKPSIQPTVEESVQKVAEPDDLSKKRSRAEFKKGLPSGFKETRMSDQRLLISNMDLPWLKKTEEIPLAMVTLSDTEGQKFYYGSIVRGKLAQVAAQLTREQNKHADTLLYTYLPDFIKRKSSFIKTIKNQITNRPICYLGNVAGQRVYFIEFGRVNDTPVIIRIAVCDKAKQDEVLAVLTTQPRSIIKGKSRL